MNLFIFSDESGTFDYLNNNYFVFGGLIFLDKKSKDNTIRLYEGIEKNIYKNIDKALKENETVKEEYNKNHELKASILKSKYKRRLFNSLKNNYKFSVIIKQKELKSKEIFDNKKSKQRYQDYAYKIALKKALLNLETNGILKLSEVEYIYIYLDEHKTATDGLYELKEALLNEFKTGTFNYDFSCFYKPIIPNLRSLEINYVDSKTNVLVRASDIIANKFFNIAINKKCTESNDIFNHIIILP